MDQPIRILFVDDERNVLRSLERTFLEENYEILTASTGAEGLSALQSVSPVQVVISDYRMPGMNGVDFLKEVRKLWPDTVRIVLSGYADAASIVAAINEGQIYKFIPKPWNDDELKVAVVNALERYFLNQKNIELTEELKTKNDELKRINNYLEHLVSKTEPKIILQNETPESVQTIDNAIPVGVIGVDHDGYIVQCNKEAMELCYYRQSDILGNRYQNKLPQEISEFIERIPGKQSMSARFVIHGQEIKVTVGFMDNCGQGGMLLIFANEGRYV